MSRFFLFLSLLLIVSCKKAETWADAYGNFEANDRLISAESNGRLLYLLDEEGAAVKKGQLLAILDSSQLLLQTAQLQAAMVAVRSKSPKIDAQLAVFDKQMAALKQQEATLQREQNRVSNLVKADAATPKQLDDLTAQRDQLVKQMDVVREQRNAMQSQLGTQQTGLLSELKPLQKQQDQLEDQMARCRVYSPLTGIVLVNYASTGEVTTYGRPLLKIASLDTLFLRAYISGVQLPLVQLGQTVYVRSDDQEKVQGRLVWIADRAEFTPKSVQTAEQRCTLVYAVKIAVPNPNGTLKIGMPGEVAFTDKAVEDKTEKK